MEETEKMQNERVFRELALILLDTLQVEGSAERVTYAALALKNAYQGGLLFGLELAEAGMVLAGLAEAEAAETLPAPAMVFVDDHPSPREAMRAAGWVNPDTISRWVETDPT